MRVSELKNLMREYEQTWYVRKFFYGDHDEAVKIRNYLNSLSHLPDQYELPADEIFKLIAQIDVNSDLNLIYAIKNLLHGHEIEIFTVLKSLKMANVSNFIKLSLTANDKKSSLCGFLSKYSSVNLYTVMMSTNAEFRQKILNTIVTLYEEKLFYLSAKENTHGLLTLLHKHNCLNEATLNVLLEQQDNLRELLEIVSALQKFNLLNYATVLSLGGQKYLFKLAEVLTELAKSRSKTLDQGLLSLIVGNIEKIYQLDKMIYVLNRANCLTKENLEILINQDIIFHSEIVSVLETLQSSCILDDATLRLVCGAVKQRSYFNECLAALAKYKLINKEHIDKLVNDNLSTLHKLINYLASHKIEAHGTIAMAFRLFLRDKATDLSLLLDCFRKSGVTIDIENFNAFCGSSRQGAIGEIFSLRRADCKITTNENLGILLRLSDAQFEYLHKFIVNNHFVLNQSAFDSILQYAVTPVVELPAQPENGSFLSSKKADTPPAFNPYIHGTSSLVLSLLERTQLSMVSPVEMLETYGSAPMGGEITGGGLEAAGARCNPCFGKLNAQGVNDYTLNRIISEYTHFVDSSVEETVRYAKKQIANSLKYAFSNVNIMLIYLARAKQRGIEAISSNEAENIKKELSATIQFFYLILLLGKKIHPNFELIENYSEEIKLDFCEAVSTHLTFANLVKRIMDFNLDIKEVHDNPTNENLLRLLTVLELPKNLQINAGWGEDSKLVSLPETQLFTINNQNYQNTSQPDHYNPDYYFHHLAQNSSNYSVDILLRNLLLGQLTPDFFSQFGAKALEHIKVLNTKIELLNKIIHTDIEVMRFSNRQKYFLEQPFSMIFICEAEEKFSLLGLTTQEYRSDSPLKIGKDIKMIATDTEAHRLAIMKFLEENSIYNTQVVLLHQLFLSQIDGKRPQSPYTHKDGFPLLSWLAAKQTPDNAQSKDKVINEKIAAARTYRSVCFQ